LSNHANVDGVFSIVDGVDNPIVSYSNALEVIRASQFPGAHGPRVRREALGRGDDAFGRRMRQIFQLLPGRASEDDAVVIHRFGDLAV
jgi:hypothetical protein